MSELVIPDNCHFFTLTQFLENKIYTEKTRKLRQNTQKIANFLRYYGKMHSKLPIFRVKSVKIYTGQNKFTRAPLVVLVTNIKYGVHKCPPNMLIQKLSQTWPQGVHSRKKYCLQVCPPKIATKMAQTWQAEIHDKKSQKKSLR